MLQPRQLERVAERFPVAIQTLRTFLEDSFPDTASPRSGTCTLAAVAAYLRSDGAFRRNLALHLKDIAHSGASSADLLGIVALSTADMGNTNAVSEDDASQVLHFILATVSSRERNANPVMPAVGRAMWHWPLALACISVSAILVTTHLLHRTAVQQGQAQKTTNLVAASSPPPGPTVAPMEVARPAFNQNPVLPVQPHSMAPRGVSPTRSSAYSGPERASVADVTPRPMAEGPSKTYTAPAEPTDGPLRSQTGLSSPAAQPRTLGKEVARPGVPAATPAAVLSQRLDARTVPASDPAIDPLSGRAYPRLWRRHPLGPATPDAGTLFADNVPPTRPGAHTATAAASSPGTVRPVSLGMMAANILYSPAPAYPAAAAVARVQGQVRIQAEVDRDGSVASARVVSGPPLLRDAALDAVLRWRYRPRTLAGKPVTAADTALMEFELP